MVCSAEESLKRSNASSTTKKICYSSGRDHTAGQQQIAGHIAGQKQIPCSTHFKKRRGLKQNFNLGESQSESEYIDGIYKTPEESGCTEIFAKGILHTRLQLNQGLTRNNNRFSFKIGISIQMCPYPNDAYSIFTPISAKFKNSPYFRSFLLFWLPLLFPHLHIMLNMHWMPLSVLTDLVEIDTHVPTVA